MTRVSNLMRHWAVVRGECDEEVVRWAALGHLHDVLRDGDPVELQAMANGEFAELPGRLLHGPVAASRLAEEGVQDDSLLLAVACHTLGHPALDTAGVALYTADFLEPGRAIGAEWRATLRQRMPTELDAVALEVATVRTEHLRVSSRLVRPETSAFLELLTERAHG
jgi:2-amino-4-hydroxy-6-hydroxymethyldihydropteridine diphosphokinase